MAYCIRFAGGKTICICKNEEGKYKGKSNENFNGRKGELFFHKLCKVTIGAAVCAF